MTRKYSLVIEGDPTGYSAYVPELPTILGTGRSVEELTDRAAEAIRLYSESVRTSPPRDGRDYAFTQMCVTRPSAISGAEILLCQIRRTRRGWSNR